MVFNATFINITYIVAVSFFGRQNLSYNVVSNTPRLSGIPTPNGSGDRH